MQFFQTNIESLQTINQNLAQTLLNIQELKKFEVFMDNEDVNTLNFVHTHHFIPLYEGSPAQTLQTQIQEYEKFAKYPYLYFYGIANGVLLKHLLQNQTHQRIVVIEPELEILYVVLHMLDFSREIKDGRFVLLGLSELNFPTARTFFNLHKEQKYAKVYDLFVNTNYYETLYLENITQTNRAFIEGVYHAINAAGNDAKDALIGLKHHILNLPKLLQTPPTTELLNKLGTTDTAILVSTGPSLSKQLPLLKKIAPFVRIIAVDASFPVLYNAGIKPDVVVSMERVKESARFFTKVPKSGYEDVIIALSSLQHKDVIQSPKGGILQISLRPLGYMIATGPKEWGYMGIGSSAANMGFELIFYSKFKRCILIGQDLAYSEDGKSHASGHVFGENDVQTKESDVWVEGWGGEKKVRTNHTWTMFRNFFEKDLGDIQDAMLTINATEGGARIYGTQELAFEQVISQYIDTKKKKKPLKLKKMPSAQHQEVSQRTSENIEKIVNYVACLLEETKALFLELAHYSDQEKEKLTIAEMQKLIVKVEKLKARQNEELYDQVVWHIAQAMMLIQEIELAPTEVYIAQDTKIEQERFTQLIDAHKAWLFSFAGVMDAILKTIEYAKVRRLIDEVQQIDVLMEGQKIDSFSTTDMQPQYGRVFDVDMRGILYDAPDIYQEKISAISFEDPKTLKELPRTFVDVITRDDDKYNELSFMKSLEEPLDKEKIKDLYCPNAIGFLATEENLEDKEFVGYIKELMVRFPAVKLKALCFSKQQIELAKKTYFNQDKVHYSLIDNIYDFVNQIEVLIYNTTKESAKTYLPQILSILRKYSPNILSFGTHFRYGDYKTMTLKELENHLSVPLSKFMENIKLLGFEKDEISQDGSFTKTLQNAVYTRFKMGESQLKDNDNAYEYWNINLIEYTLKNQQFKKFYFDMITKQVEVLYGKKS